MRFKRIVDVIDAEFAAAERLSDDKAIERRLQALGHRVRKARREAVNKRQWQQIVLHLTDRAVNP